MSNKKIITLDNLEAYTEKVGQTYAKKTELFSKDYNELKNKPTIPDISGKADKSELENLADKNYVDNKVADLVNSAPETLDTLGELAAAIKDNEDVVEALNAAIGDKTDREDVLDIIEENSSEADELMIGRVDVFDPTNDAQIPTSKAVSEYVKNNSSGEETASRLLKIYVPESTTEQHLEPNKYYIFQPQVAPELTLTFAEEDEEYLDEFMGEIQLDETSVMLNMPKNIVWREADGVTETETGISLEEKHMYIFSVMSNIGLISCVKNPTLDKPVATVTEDNKLIWEPIDGADYYEVMRTTILGSTGTLLVRTEDTSLDLTLVDEFNKTEVFYLCVWACSKKYTDSYSSTYSYKGTGTLEAPINLILNDNNQLSWDPINFETSSSVGTGYMVELVETGSSTTVTTNLCDLSTSFTELTTPGTYTFIVRSRVNDILNTNIV